MKVNQIRAGAALSYVSMALSTIISLVYTPILLDRLGDPAFQRCHYSLAVSLDHAAVFRRESFLMKDGTVVPISHGYYPAVREQFRKYHHIEL